VIARAAWHVGTVARTSPETATARRIVLDVPTWPGNEAGQHLDVRLTAPDGYQASRSYSIASAGAHPSVELAVDRVPEGEVSPFLVDELRVGDQIELRGPLGGWFVWTPPAREGGDADIRPVQLIGGGSGVVPLISMIRAHRAAEDATPFRLLYSVRSPEEIFYREELADAASARAPLEIDYVYTREAPEGWPTPPGRVTRAALESAVFAASGDPRLFVCGSTGFVETVLGWLVDLGHDAKGIRAERFGGA
jgi:ferredoxin-NADP reductase